jgi:phosphomethylpyrimidine synthase
MKISQEVREFAKLQNQDSAGFIAVEEAEKGMAKMSEVYEETGRELYMGAGGREHD